MHINLVHNQIDNKLSKIILSNQYTYSWTSVFETRRNHVGNFVGIILVLWTRKLKQTITEDVSFDDGRGGGGDKVFSIGGELDGVVVGGVVVPRSKSVDGSSRLIGRSDDIRISWFDRFLDRSWLDECVDEAPDPLWGPTPGDEDRECRFEVELTNVGSFELKQRTEMSVNKRRKVNNLSCRKELETL